MRTTIYVRNWAKSNTAEKLIRTSHDKAYERSKLKEVAKSIEDCEKMLSQETENLVDKNVIIWDEISVKFGQLSMFGAL